MLEEFSTETIETSGARIRVRQSGSGPAILLLHGFPQTHVIWHKVAPLLARNYRVVLSDLRGYGDSEIRSGTPSESDYSFRAMAADQLEVMKALGHDEFFLIGHDRGARTAWRLARDYPQSVKKLALIDILPTQYVWDHISLPWAMTAWHWLFLAQPGDFPQRMAQAIPPSDLMAALLRDPATGPSPHTPEAYAEYVRCCNSKTIAAWCGDYRAAATTDLLHDSLDKKDKFDRPVFLAWSDASHVAKGANPLSVWSEHCRDVSGGPIRSSHYIPEEAPEALLDGLLPFLRR